MVPASRHPSQFLLVEARGENVKPPAMSPAIAARHAGREGYGPSFPSRHRPRHKACRRSPVHASRRSFQDGRFRENRAGGAPHRLFVHRQKPQRKGYLPRYERICRRDRRAPRLTRRASRLDVTRAAPCGAVPSPAGPRNAPRPHRRKYRAGYRSALPAPWPETRRHAPRCSPPVPAEAPPHWRSG